MADTTTTNYGWVKPEITASNDTWGSKLNTNFDNIDSKVKTIDVPTAAAKTALVDADLVGSYDSAGAFAARKTTFAQFKASLPTMAQQNKNAVDITGGSVEGLTHFSIVNSPAATPIEFAKMVPSDWGVGKTGLFFNRSSTTQYTIGLWDGATTNGILNFNSQYLRFNGTDLVTVAGATFSGDVITPRLYATGGDIVIRAAGNKHVWFQTAASVNRGAVYYENALSAVQVNLYNTAGTYVRAMRFQEDGGAYWEGNMVQIGYNSGTAELRLSANVNSDYRILGDSGGGLYIQRSTNEWAGATTLLYWNATGGAVFQNHVYATTFQSSANGDGTSYKIGDDAWIGDCNTSDTLSIRGQQDFNSGFIRFGNGTNKLGVFSSVTDRLYWGPTFFMQSDGNMWLPMYGDYLSNALAAKATVYTGSTQDETNFPVGHTVLAGAGDGAVYVRNSAVAIGLSSTYTYTPGGSPGLAGTWRARGGYDSPGSGAWAYQFQRTA